MFQDNHTETFEKCVNNRRNNFPKNEIDKIRLKSYNINRW